VTDLASTHTAEEDEVKIQDDGVFRFLSLRNLTQPDASIVLTTGTVTQRQTFYEDQPESPVVEVLEKLVDEVTFDEEEQ